MNVALTSPYFSGETRYSVTGYSAGGLWRYVAQGHRTRKAWENVDLDEAVAHDAGGALRWDFGCAMFKTIQELQVIWGGPDAAA